MFFKIVLVLLILLSVGVVFVGCFGEADNPLQEDAEEQDAVKAIEEAPKNEGLLSQVPVVRLVSEGIEWQDDRGHGLGARAFLWSHAEIDSPVEHHLFLYIETEAHNQDDDFFDRPGDVRRTRSLVVIERGKIKTGKFGTSTRRGNHMHKKLVVRLLPGEEREEVRLPANFSFGVPERGLGRNSGTVPKNYEFNPYTVGDPSEVFHEFDLEE